MPRPTGPSYNTDSRDEIQHSWDPLLPGLLTNKPWAFWHEESGLITSPNCQSLPTSPLSFVPNERVYELFYPTFPVNTGIILEKLDEDIDSNIEVFSFVEDYDPEEIRYRLKPSLRNRWRSLEMILMEIVHHLCRHQEIYTKFPNIELPVLPWQCGYREDHKSHRAAVRCAQKSRDAFTNLGALVTFALTLHLGTRRDTCFQRAFYFLNISGPRMNPTWISSLEESYICSISSGTRRGGLIDPYHWIWGPLLTRFVSAGVPLWFVWGKRYMDTISVDMNLRKGLLPPNDIIEAARMRTRERKEYYNKPLPFDEPMNIYTDPPEDTYANYPDEELYPEPEGIEPGPPGPGNCVEAGSGQKPHETPEAFFARLEKECTQYIKNEQPRHRQSRESREQFAATGQRADSCSVYEWNQDGPFWRRVRVEKEDVSGVWDDHTEHQRRYTGYLNEWDLCSFLPRYPAGVVPPQHENFDPDDDPILPISTTQRPSEQEIQQIVTDDLRLLESTARGNAVSAVNVTAGTFIEYLFLRHGFRATTDYHQYTHLYPSPRFSLSNAAAVIKSFSYNVKNADNSLSPFHEAIAGFHAILSNPELGLDNLPAEWDIGRGGPNSLSLSRVGFSLRYVPTPHRKTLFCIVKDLAVVGDWVVATFDATVILLAFRSTSEWATLDDLVCLFIRRGIPFFTPRMLPQQDYRRPSNARDIPRGLGFKNSGFRPSRLDYLAYVKKRDDLLTSSVDGAVCLKMGGLVARIARNVVEESRVLRGPHNHDFLLAEADGLVFVDDNISNESLDIVCGVYYVSTTAAGANAPNASYAHSSFWPKEFIWHNKVGYEIGEWTPAAEEWYQNTASDLQRLYLILPSGSWGSKLKFFRKHVNPLLQNSSARAAEYIYSVVPQSPRF